MRLIGRLFVIAFAFLAACIVASIVVFAAWVVPEMMDLAMNPIDNDTLNVIFGIGYIVFSGFALLPALIAILLTEAFSMRSILSYAIAGGLAGLCCYLAFIPFDTGTMRFDGIIRHHLEVMIGSGIVAGLAYWLIAGRNAGRWREGTARRTAAVAEKLRLMPSRTPLRSSP